MRRLPRSVLILSLVSFFTDFSSEMIYPLLPVFLSTVLGAGALALGAIEGIAESTSALFKIISGYWADRVQNRKPFILTGYGLAGFVRPLVALAGAWPVVLVLRFVDRIGKGIRTSPRDALIADVTSPGERGRAFGFHRASDHAGAVVGPLVAAALLGIESVSIRHIFLLSAIPAAIVVAIICLYIKEPKTRKKTQPAQLDLKGQWSDLGRNFKLFLVAMLVFTLGNSTDAFLLLRMSSVGVPAAWVAVLWAAHHVVKMISTYLGGRLSDGLGSRSLIISGWIVYALVYLAFAYANTPLSLIIVFLAYGVYFGLTEPAEKSWVAELVPGNLRGTGFGYYHGVTGLGALPASLIFGFVWHKLGAPAAFAMGAALALAAAILLLPIREREESSGMMEQTTHSAHMP